MDHSSHAVLSYAIALLRALLTPARGRHSAAVRRRRSTRVQAEALARLDRWTSRVPSGDLPAPAPPPRVPADDLGPAVAA